MASFLSIDKTSMLGNIRFIAFEAEFINSRYVRNMCDRPFYGIYNSIWSENKINPIYHCFMAEKPLSRQFQ
jgi:hypothetical protein